MKRKEIIFSITALVILLTACLTLNAKSVQAAQPDETIAVETYEKAVSMLAHSVEAVPILFSIDRTRLIDDIYKYSFIFKVGSGDFDKIGVYRVVKEKQSVPIKAKDAVMLLHGDTSDFDSAFLMSTMSDKVSAYHSLGIYLAQNNVDVWGVDRRWTFVPDNYPGTDVPYCYISEDECAFMQDWDTALHLSDIKIAVKFAREIRDETGSGSDKIFMLGHSRGAALAYAYANDETQIAKRRQDLRGIISIDMAYKFDPENHSQEILDACTRYEILKWMHVSGTYYSDEATQMKAIAFLAANNPEGHDLDTFLTNQQVGWLVLSATYATYPEPFPPPVPFYHSCAGTFDEESGLPTGLQFTNSDYMLDLAFAVPSFQSLGEMIDGEALWCGDDTPYDDHLEDITIPVFYVGAAGGFGEYGVYTTTLLGSYDKDNPHNDDVNTLIVELYPPEAAALDYGHIDLLFADNAKSLVWKPIYKWIKKTH